MEVDLVALWVEAGKMEAMWAMVARVVMVMAEGSLAAKRVEAERVGVLKVEVNMAGVMVVARVVETVVGPAAVMASVMAAAMAAAWVVVLVGTRVGPAAEAVSVVAVKEEVVTVEARMVVAGKVGVV